MVHGTALMSTGNSTLQRCHVYILVRLHHTSHDRNMVDSNMHFRGIHKHLNSEARVIGGLQWLNYVHYQYNLFACVPCMHVHRYVYLPATLVKIQLFSTNSIRSTDGKLSCMVKIPNNCSSFHNSKGGKNRPCMYPAR